MKAFQTSARALLCFVAGLSVAQSFVEAFDCSPDSVLLKNAAKPDVCMPVVGLGTGHCNPTEGGECMNDTTTEKAVRDFLAVGGRRIDSAITYHGQAGTAKAMKESGIAREQIFVTSKLGPGDALGYNEALSQFDSILKALETPYVDLLLIHWPGPPGNSSDPNCRPGLSNYTKCRQVTWKALVEIFNSGRARAIGVSNFEMNHLQDIFELGGPLPALNQVEFHPYWHEDDLVAFCQNHSIVFNGYSPMASNDWAPTYHHWPTPLLSQPILSTIAHAHNRTVGQVALRWQFQQGIVVNPRSQNKEHMNENTHIFDFELSQTEMESIAKITPPPTHPKVFEDPHDIR